MIKGMRKGSRRWAVLNYAVSEPEQWTTNQIADDLGEKYATINEAVINLKQRGFVVAGKKVGRSFTLLPTPEGVEVFSKTNGN